MAQFFGTVQGSRGQASRLGSKKGGLTVTAASWQGRIEVILYHDVADGQDKFCIRQVPHHGRGIHQVIAEGIVGERY